MKSFLEGPGAKQGLGLPAALPGGKSSQDHPETLGDSEVGSSEQCQETTFLSSIYNNLLLKPLKEKSGNTLTVFMYCSVCKLACLYEEL